MNAECRRIADQLRRAFSGDPWHGSPIRDLLEGITGEQACAHPLPSAHNIWDLVLHIEVYLDVALKATEGTPMPRLFGTEQDWPTATDRSAPAWPGTMQRLLESCERLAQAIDEFADQRLQDSVPGREYDFYYLLHGIVQHSLYHAGQIAMLKKAVTAESRDVTASSPSGKS
jgi:hypothetical protein